MNKPSLQPEVDSRVSFGSLIAAGLIVAALFCVGLAVSAAWYYVTPKVFESSATVLIEPRRPAPTLNKGGDSGSFDYRHDQLIGEDNIIMKALIKYNLNELSTLHDLSAEDQIRHIQSNFLVLQTGQNEGVYELRYMSRDPRDAQTVLATLASTYEKHLGEKYRSVSPETHELLLKLKKRFDDELAAKTDKIEQLEKQIAAGQTDEDIKATLVELQEERELMIRKRDEADSFVSGEMSAEEMLKEKLETQARGFNFETLSPASKGYLVYPRLPVFLLAGGFGGLLIGFFTAGLMIAVLSNRR